VGGRLFKSDANKQRDENSIERNEWKIVVDEVKTLAIEL
jgi:hypothetical protein